MVAVFVLHAMCGNSVAFGTCSSGYSFVIGSGSCTSRMACALWLCVKKLVSAYASTTNPLEVHS